MSSTKNLNAENFENEISGSKVPVLVDFGPNGVPCKALSPILDEISDELEGKVAISKVNQTKIKT